MKKILLSIVAVLFAANSFAQYSSGGFSLSESSVYYGIRLGLNVSNISGDDAGNLGAKSGLNFGGVIGLRVSDTTPIFLESGLYYTERGGQKSSKNYAGLDYLEIPILIKYGVQLNDEIAVLPYIGPTFSFGIAGQEKWDAEHNIYSETTPKTEYSKDSSYEHYNHLDMGIKIGCGIEWNKLYLEAGYQFGLANIRDYKDDEQRGNAFFVNLGVNF